MKKTGNIFLFIFLSLVASLVVAADVRVEASVDRNQMGIGDSFVLNISVRSDEDFELGLPQLPKVAGLEVVNSIPGGRQSSSSMNIVNGKTKFVSQTSQDYNFVLSPQKEGSFVIPAIDIQINGNSYKTNPIKIDVQEEYRNSKAQAKGKPRFPPGYGGSKNNDDEESGLGSIQDTEDLFEQLLKQQQRMFGAGGGSAGGGFGQPNQGGGQIPSKQLNNVNTNEAFFIYLDVDKTEVYEGEQITANWYIYTRANMESLDRVKFPDLKGFWKEIIEEVPALQFTEELVNGIRYRKALLASHALFPIKAGNAAIDEFKVKARVRMPTQFGWGQPQDFTKASKRVEIKVLPLPNEGRTQSFSGAVGNYRISLKTDGNTFPAHQPFSIKIRYEGIGNAKLIDLPAISWPQGLEIYDTKSESKFFKEGQSYKEFEVLAIPRKEGEMIIPPLDLTYFDPQQKNYVSESTTELKLQITAGTQQGTGATSGATKPNDTVEEAFVPQPILQFPQAGFEFSAYRFPIYLITLILGVLSLLAYFSMQLKNLKFEPEFLTSVNAKVKLIEKYVDTNDYRKIGSESTNLIYILVANLAGQKKADQEIHILFNEISSKDQQLFLQRITQLFDYFQLLGFSPEEIMRSTLNKKPIKEQTEELKVLTKEIVAKLKKQDKYNE
ncbi:MAG: BatD family protein [Pseudobdellovibrio sp.]